MQPPTDLLHPDARWDDLLEVLLEFSRRDLAESPDDPRLYVVAATGTRPSMLAISRPWEKGQHNAPVVELGSLALGLGADRLGVAVTARAWSALDPIVPVLDDVDLRQRVLCAHVADGHGRDEALVTCALQPFAVEDGDLVFDEPVTMGRGEGWIPGALEVVVTERAALVGDPEQTADQARRCEALGHLVGLAPHHQDELFAGS